MPELYLALLDRILTPVPLMLAVIFLLAGHNAPGGGFIAGLVVATAFLMQIMARGDAFGTPTLFDIGVFLVVSAFVTSYLLELSRPVKEGGRK